MQGRYRLTFKSGKEIVLPNNLVDEGEEAFMKMIFQDDQTDVSGGGNYFVGLMGSTFAETTTLATLAGEPTSAGGYARQSLARNSTGFPTIDQVNGKYRALSAAATFAASGADFSTTFSRLFLCNVVSGSSGLLFSVSSALTTALLVANGESFVAQYEMYMN